MAQQIFKQRSNKMLAFAFAGLITVSQLMVLNMGYLIPWYFLVILATLCIVIIWSMLDHDCILEGDVLIIKAGLFNNKIEIAKIEELIKDSKLFFKGKNSAYKLVIVYNKNRRFNIFPEEKTQLINALKKINPKIKVK